MAYDEGAKLNLDHDAGRDRLYQVETPAPHSQGIGWAVKNMHHGLKVRRRGWNGRGMWIAMQVPDTNSKMTLPYIYMKTVNGELVPWLCSQTDLLAMDWEPATV